MEIVLQWLDDLDDAVFVVLLALERLRRRCLQIGFASSLALAACTLDAAAPGWVPLLAGVSVATVAAALGGAALTALAERRSPPTA